MPRTRDTQREKLYHAQSGLHFSIVDKISLDQVRKLYEEILSSEWAGKEWINLRTKRMSSGNFPRPKVLRNGRMRSAAAWHRGGDIEFADGPISKVTAIHEFAHWIVSTLNRDWSQRKQPAGHGREFAAVYLTLVRHVFGKDAHDMLRQSFVAHGVSYKAKRVLTGATLEAARERGRKLAAARAAKQLARPTFGQQMHRTIQQIAQERHDAMASFDQEFLNR